MSRTSEIDSVPADQVDQVVQDFKDAGASKVDKTLQPDGTYNVIATFDDSGSGTVTAVTPAPTPTPPPSKASSPPAPPPSTTPAAPQPTLHHVLASSFADPADVAAFRKCKAQGKSDQQCFKVGDNGIGFMGDDCTTSTPMCALPVEDWMEKWGGRTQARLKPVLVTINGLTVTCLMGDTMPRRADITNGAGIDLSPGAVAAFQHHPPLMVHATWCWADEAVQAT